MTSSLPYRFRKEAFDRYELAIADIVDKFPNICTFYPVQSGLSPTTFSCRLRDAMNSAHDNHWPSKLINLAKFYDVHKDIVVSERPDGTVIVGSRDTIRTPITPTKVATPNFQGDAIDFSIDTMADAELIGKLAAKRAFVGPLRLTNLTEELADFLAANFDVEITKQPDNSYILI